MTEPTDQGGDQQQDEGQQQAAAYTPPATQAEFDRIIADRVNRTKAQFKDYAELKAFRQANQSADERAQQELTRLQSENERWRTTAVSSRVEALAAADFADPTDAALVLTDLSKYLDAAGNVDDNAIRADLAAVLDRKPKWRKQDDAPMGPRLPFPNPAQGSGERPSASSPNDLMNALIRSHRGGQ